MTVTRSMTAVPAPSASHPKPQHGRRRAAASLKLASSPRALLRDALGVPTVSIDAVAAYRPRAAELIECITDRIAAEVSGFADADDPRVREGVGLAIEKSVTLFIDTLAGAPTRGTEVFALFRWIGEIEATVGHNLDAVRGAHHIATTESWKDLSGAAKDLGLSAEQIGQLTSALITYQTMLFDHAEAGFTQASARPEQVKSSARRDLLHALFAGAGSADLAELAEAARWPLPEDIAVIAARCDDATAHALGECAQVLALLNDGVLVAVAPAELADAVTGKLARRIGSPVALSWTVPICEAADAQRWARRALVLAAEGQTVPGDDGVVRCDDVQSLLCLHADPALRRRADEQLLAPLMSERPTQRIALAETLLALLQTRESAPRLAVRLDVHEQTIRNRLRRLKALFGARLNDPSQTVGLLSALESATPRWR